MNTFHEQIASIDPNMDYESRMKWFRAYYIMWIQQPIELTLIPKQ